MTSFVWNEADPSSPETVSMKPYAMEKNGLKVKKFFDLTEDYF